MLSDVTLEGSNWKVKIFWETTEHDLGVVLAIEGNRIQKCLVHHTSIVDDRYRKIVNGKSLPCNEFGRVDI